MPIATFDPAALLERRTAKHFSQADLAYRTGLSVSTIRALERGRHAEPNLHTLQLLAAVLGCQMLDLTTTTEEG